MKKLLIIIFSLAFTAPSYAQSSNDKASGNYYKALGNYFATYKTNGQEIRNKMKLESVDINDPLHTIQITANKAFSEQMFTPEGVQATYDNIKALLPDSLKNYQISVISGGWEISKLVANYRRSKQDASRTWGRTEYRDEPWVKNASRPYSITEGLRNRHFSIWSSHGIYYNIPEARWKWQRPPLFGTSEDFFTQTIVTPYLMPMLEKAGAVVFSPRERDWQKNEIIVDNDNTQSGYQEFIQHDTWHKAPRPGFAFHEGHYYDHENPFEAGTARMIESSNHQHRLSSAIYQPTIPEAGRYAVYVSYQTIERSVDDARYTVWHKGIPTVFHVNQQMGGSTWVYLGTFDFDAGNSKENRVELSNYSDGFGYITTDAVRFGGGMGNIERGGSTSGMPRCLEGARYYAQWAGMPYDVYSSKEGKDDYGDDINVRSLMTNLLAGGSCYLPDTIGRNVPIELAMAVHSDAGYTRDGKTNTGTLTICMTTLNDSTFQTGLTRLVSRDLADELLYTIPRDILQKYGKWKTRELYDRNYSECRVPAVPSVILETLSHQNFADMRMAQDPHFRFDLARSIYKAILRYTARMHNTRYTVTPLTPEDLQVNLTNKGEARLSWTAVEDPLEPTAHPTSYIVYTARDDGDFDNGTLFKSSNTTATIAIEPDHLYSFRVAAVNAGGESFPSEVVSALYNPTAQKKILIVNNFHRLAAPQVVDGLASQGFDLSEDMGISYGLTAGWRGYQQNMDKFQMGKEGPTGLGFTNDSLAGHFIAGNDFNYVRTHASAIAAAKRYSITSCSSRALEHGKASLQGYALVDLILGLERNDGYTPVEYHAFSEEMRAHLRAFTSQGGSLLVSGSYIGRDSRLPQERQFLEDVLKCQYGGTNTDSLQRDSVQGLGTVFSFYHQPNHVHYAAQHPDNLLPLQPAYAAMKYGDDQSACVAYNGLDYRALTMGFPFECIRSEQKRIALMRGFMQFLIQ